MKKLVFVLLLFTSITYSQSKGTGQFTSTSSISYEIRTNGNSYLSIAHKGIALRHRSDKLENRITYKRNFFKDSSKLYLSIPLHYKIEKSEPTLKPALIYQFPKLNLLIQKEFWYKSSKNATIAIDYPYKAVTFRVGWDTSDTFRFRLGYKF